MQTALDANDLRLFEDDSDTFKACVAYFDTGDDAGREYPFGGFQVARWVKTAIEGEVTGAVPETVADIKTAVADAAASLTVGGAVLALAALTALKTAVASASDAGAVATAYQVAIRTIAGYNQSTVVFSAGSRYVFTNPRWHGSRAHRHDCRGGRLDRFSHGC